jgi:hypothetical protein
MEDKYRTLAAVIAALISEIVSFYFFRGFLGFAAGITIVALSILRFSPFPFLIGILISIDANLLLQNKLSDFYLVAGITLVIIILGVFSEMVDRKAKTQGAKSLKKEVVFNCLAMGSGILLALIVQSIRCPQLIVNNGSITEGLVSSWFGVHACAAGPVKDAVTTAFKTKSNSFPSILNAILLMILMIPLTWGLIINALRQVRFNISRFPSIIGYIFIGLVGWFLSYLPYNIFLWIMGIISVAVLGLETPPQEMIFISLLLDMTLSILCVGYFTAVIAGRRRNV